MGVFECGAYVRMSHSLLNQSRGLALSQPASYAPMPEIVLAEVFWQICACSSRLEGLSETFDAITGCVVTAAVACACWAASSAKRRLNDAGAS